MIVPSVALMLYGVLNTHNEINAPGSGLRSLQHLLLEMASAGKIDLDIFVHTEDKCFFKWTPPEKVDGTSVRGFPRIAEIEDRYLVCQYDAERIRKDLIGLYGEHLKKVHIDENAFDLEQWSSSKEKYNLRETTNKWRNTMITTFLRRKKSVFEMANAYLGSGAGNYGAYVLARPDSKLASLVEKSEEKTKEELLRYLQHCNRTVRPTVHYQLSNIHPQSFQANPGLAMLANDFIIGNQAGMSLKVGLIDYIDENFGGNFFEAYSEPVYRCTKCFHMEEAAQKPRTCSKCAAEAPQLVTEWPEYKMFKHLSTNNAEMQPAGFRSNVVR